MLGPGVDDVEEQLDEDVADGLRARVAGLRGDERARDAVAKQLLVGEGTVLGADELPPADLFVLCHRAARDTT